MVNSLIPVGSETAIFCDNWVNFVDAYVLALWIGMLSANMELTILHERASTFHEKA